MRRSGNAIDDEAPIQRTRMRCKLPSVVSVPNTRRTISINLNQGNRRPYRTTDLLGPPETQ